MKISVNLVRLFASLLLVVAVSGCSAWKKVAGEKADYKQSRVEPSLEVPPDLHSQEIEDALAVPGSGSATYSDYAAGDRTAQAGAQSGVMYQPENMKIERDGDKHWLVVQAPPEAIWPKVRDFWLQAGFLLTVDDPSIGIVETDWAENRADIPQDVVRRTIGKALSFLYSSATRDRFRVRLERAEGGQTELFLSHRGMEEVVQGGADSDTGTIWRPRPSDPELEAEMLKRLMVYLGTEEGKAAAQIAEAAKPRAAQSQLIVAADGSSTLMVEEGFSRAWRQVGLALDRVGFTVEDRDRSSGVYFVRYNDPLKEDRKKGILSKLAFWRDDDPESAEQYRVLLTAEGERTKVTVQNAQAQPDSSPTARRILTLIHEQMK